MTAKTLFLSIPKGNIDALVKARILSRNDIRKYLVATVYYNIPASVPVMQRYEQTAEICGISAERVRKIIRQTTSLL